MMVCGGNDDAGDRLVVASVSASTSIDVFMAVTWNPCNKQKNANLGTVVGRRKGTQCFQFAIESLV